MYSRQHRITVERALWMTKEFIVLALCATLLFLLGAGLSGCTEEPSILENPVQAFISENLEALEESTRDHREILGPGSTVTFEAGTDELIYLYTFGPEHTADQLEEYTRAFLALPANKDMYEVLAGDLASLMELTTLTLTIKYYDAQGEYIISESFRSP